MNYSRVTIKLNVYNNFEPDCSSSLSIGLKYVYVSLYV